MVELVAPHGGDHLKALILSEDERAAARTRARGLKRVPMTSREASDVLLMAMGAYTPLDGFMGEADWRGICADMRREDGLFWPIPITLSADSALGASIQSGEEIALVDAESDSLLALMEVAETYAVDREFECANVFRTTDTAHPGVEKVMRQGGVNLAGKVAVIDEGAVPRTFEHLYLRPAETRALFGRLGWSRVAAFQTRNPMHRSHEHLVKIALEVTDGVFIHQVLGKLKPGDIPADVRTRAIAAMVDHYFIAGTVVQAGYPIEMRYAGPREALLHALIRQNFGCSHLIVGRDHAGVGDYYGPFEAQEIFDNLWPGALETRPLKIGETFFCHRCEGMATARSCPHGAENRVTISGTRQREMLAKGEDIPREFSRPEVVAILKAFYSDRN